MPGNWTEALAAATAHRTASGNSFFLVMALIVPTATRRGWGMQGIFFAMVLSAACAYLLPLVFFFTLRPFTDQLEGWMRMQGFVPPSLEDVFPVFVTLPLVAVTFAVTEIS